MSIYQRAIDKYGAAAQLEMLVEECAELIVALKHLARSRIGPELVAEEVADVLIMLEQARLIIGPQLVDRAMDAKLDRLAKRCEAKEGAEP